MKILDVEQGSQAWFEARAGIPTASEFGALITPKGEIRIGQMPQTYLATKLAEAWLQGPLPGYSGWATDQGQFSEGEAYGWASFELGWNLRKVGFITNDAGTVGCSPDGLVGDDSGLELKAPEPHTHVKYLIRGALPDDYVAQVQGAMLVTGFRVWHFISYRRNFPPVILPVKRDEKFIDNLQRALDEFHERLTAGMEMMIKLNGGKKPARREKMVFSDEIARGAQYDTAEGVTP